MGLASSQDYNRHWIDVDETEAGAPEMQQSKVWVLLTGAPFLASTCSKEEREGEGEGPGMDNEGKQKKKRRKKKKSHPSGMLELQFCSKRAGRLRMHTQSHDSGPGLQC